MPAPLRNQARFVFLDPHARELYADWNEVAADTVAMLRLDAGRYPDDEKLSALVGELSIRSVEFRSWWSKHNVERRTTGTKAYHHPLVGDLTVKYQALNPSGDPDQVLIVYTTDPGSARRNVAAPPGQLAPRRTAPVDHRHPILTRCSGQAGGSCPSCCRTEYRFATPQWSVIFPSRTRIASTVSN